MGAWRFRQLRWLVGCWAILSCVALRVCASLEAYDSAINQDAAGGLMPVARLISAVSLSGSGPVAFNFGTNSGSATFEFVLEGNPAVNNSAYLAVGANASSNLRYNLYNNTGQLGFTQLGVMDYAFNPGVPSPIQPAHVAYVWNAEARTMRLFLNGKLAGTCSSVSSSFSMPSGEGWLGANPGGGEPMVGTISRVTGYDGMVSEEVLLAHADAFNGLVRPPAILSFSASPPVIFTPNSTMLAWEVRNASAVFVNNTDVSTRSNLTVSPSVSSAYSLVASNAGGTVTAQLTVQVNPAPVIDLFTAGQRYANPGDAVTLSWKVAFAESLVLAPDVGDVTGRTVAGAGSVSVQPGESTDYVLTARNAFGTVSATVPIHLVRAANHLVISEFMADDRSTLPDEEGKFSGWIELYNPTTSAVDLGGFFLTDNAVDLTRWALPKTNLTAGGYLVVFASGQDRAQAGATLHTNFRLKNDGEYLALVGPGPTVVHAFAPAYPQQRPNISYGILAGDMGLMCSMNVPTPGTANQDTPPPPEPVRFSRPSGTFSEPWALTLSASEPGAEIRFTVDGSAPGLNAGERYVGPILLTNTTHVRAVAITNGLVGQLAGASYIKLAADLAAYTSPLPIMVIDDFGAGAIEQKGWNSTGQDIKQVPRKTAAWMAFEPAAGSCSLTNAPQMLTLAGIRGRGAYSTEWRQKPYSVEAVDEQGAEAEVSPLGLPAHADWVLYFPDPDPNKDPTLLFNTFAYELSRTFGHYAVRFRWVEAFVHEDGGELRLADRRGVYAIVEKVARGQERLNFRRLSDDGSSGGWLLNINRMDPEPDTGWPAPNGATQPWFFHTPGPDRILQTRPNVAYSAVPGGDLPQQWNAFINFENPNGYLINLNQRAAIEGWLQRFESVLYDDSSWRDPANGYRRYLDPLDFADYFILNVLTRNGDGLLLSMFPWKGDDDRLRMGPAWDYNWSSYYISGGPTGSLMHRSDQLWFARLFADPDFLQLYIDRWWELRRSVLSNSAMNAIIDRQAADITPAKALLNGMPGAAEWDRRRQQMKDWLNQRADWIDSNYLPPPKLNQDGGDVPDGFPVVVTGGSGTIYVTTDGSDPRAPGGAVSSSARVYSGPFELHSQTLVQARVKKAATWSGLTTALFSTPQDLSKLVLTEIMFRPLARGAWDAQELEFLELKNAGARALELGLFQFNRGLEFTFTNNTQLDPGQFFVLARNAAAISQTYSGIRVNGLYTGKLSNSGETIRLATPSGQTVFEITFSNNSPWPTSPATGYSLVPREAAPANSTDARDWRLSTEAGGSPGRDDPVDLQSDRDGDGMLDWQEYLAGTDPEDPHSLLKFDSVVITQNAELTLTFRAAANRSYSIEAADALRTQTWSTVAEIAAEPSSRVEVRSFPAPGPMRFYRLATRPNP